MLNLRNYNYQFQDRVHTFFSAKKPIKRKYLAYLYITALLSSLITPFAFATDTPHLWEISGKDQHGVSGKFYILPVSHSGLDVEYDSYFYKTVVPIAVAADAFLFEGAVLNPAKIPPCPVPLADTKENRDLLDHARAVVLTAQVESYIPLLHKVEKDNPSLTAQDKVELRQMYKLAAENETKDLSEYGLITSLKKNFSRFNEQAERVQSDLKLVLPVANYLGLQRKLIHVESIDSSSDIVDAYCDIGQTRNKYFKEQLESLQSFQPTTSQQRASHNVALREMFKTGHVLATYADSQDFDNSIVCARSEKWEKKMRKNFGDGTQFYALGAAHVLQPDPNHHLCDGLLERFKKSGLTVRLIE